LHFHEVYHDIIKWAKFTTEVNGTLADALLVLVGAMLNWRAWLIGWVRLTEALFIMAVNGVAIK
jgi:hypothetical protein